MTITEQREYQRLLARFIGETQLLQQLNGKTILLTGATGMIGSFLVDVLMTRNRQLPAARQTAVIALAAAGAPRSSALRRGRTASGSVFWPAMWHRSFLRCRCSRITTFTPPAPPILWLMPRSR